MRKFGLLSWLFVAGALSMARSASAARIWVQQPGTAKEIGVASNDMPWIVDSNGVVQYGTREMACGAGICVETGNVEWHVLGPGIAAHIAVALDNTVIMTDPSHRDIWLPVTQVSEEISGLNGNNWFNYFSSAPAGRPNNWYNVPTYYGSTGGTPACTGRIALSADHNDYTSYAGVGCDGNLYGLTPNWRWRNGVLLSGNRVWNLLTTGAKQISIFSQVNSVLNQAWWVLRNDAHLHVWGSDGFKMIEVPRWSNGKAVPGGVTYATDGFAIAGNFVWRWTQDISGGTGDARQDWEMYIGTTPNAPLAQIAHAGALPPPNYYGGWAGPSRLWALDTAGRIYVQSEDGSSN